MSPAASRAGRRTDFAVNGLTGLRGERPDVDVFARKDPAVDRHRQLDSTGQRLAVGFFFDDLRQLADDELQRRRDALRVRDAPGPHAEPGVGRDRDLAGVVLGIVLGLLSRAAASPSAPRTSESSSSCSFGLALTPGAGHVQTASRRAGRGRRREPGPSCPAGRRRERCTAPPALG